ncbi:MAG: type II secretion system F family protein [Planctomycetota bacterium]|jgi:tight adherence protein C
MEFWIYIAAGGATFLVVWAVTDMYREFMHGGAFLEGPSSEMRFLPFRYTLPLARAAGVPLARYAAGLEMRKKADESSSVYLAFRTKIFKLLMAAGNPGPMTPDEFGGLMIVWTLIGFILGLATWGMVQTLDPQDLPRLLLVAIVQGSILLIPALPILGFFLPLIWLRDTIRTRHTAMRKKLPYALDLLTLGVEAGLDFTAALRRIVDKLGHNPLSEEFARMLQEILMGKNRAEALRDLGQRNNLIDLTSVVSALVQADELGAPLGPILRIQSEQIRVKRAQYAEEAAMKAPVKVIFPLAFCIFPATLLIIIGPMAIRYVPVLLGTGE